MRIRWLICGVLLLCSLLFVFCGCENEAGIPTDTAAVTMDASSQKPPRADGKVEMHYAVGTAGGGRIEGWSTQHGMPGEETEREVTAYAFPGYRFSHWSDGSEEENRRDVFGEGDTEITAYFVMERAELPIFMIDTATGRDVTSKDEYVGATVSLCNTGSSSYEMSVLPAEIRGRGNATWGMEKKSYRLKFEDKQQPLGLGSGPSRSWVLMANHCDQSLMRNYLSIFMANRMDGIGFNSNGAMVEVYLNGKYHGVYLLCEQIQEGDYRINLGREEYPEKTPSDPGFLVELDMYAEGDYRFEINGHPYQAKSFVYSWKEFDYIKDYILRVEEAIYSGDKARVEEVLDLDSAVDGYILEEFFKNIDVGWSSFYMYKREGADEVLHLGPFWDFDLAAGNDMRLDNGDWRGIYVAKNMWEFSQRNRWFVHLCDWEWFRQMVVDRWQEILPAVDATIAECERLTNEANTAMNRNFDAWPIFGRRINQEPEHVMALRSFDAHADYLLDWLKNRRDWLTKTYQTEASFAKARER